MVVREIGLVGNGGRNSYYKSTHSMTQWWEHYLGEKAKMAAKRATVSIKKNVEKGIGTHASTLNLLDSFCGQICIT